MPQAGIQSRLRIGRRSVAMATGIFLLLAQLAGAAHVHQRFLDTSLTGAAATAIDDGLCALCLFHFHSPSASSPAPEPGTPLASHEFASFANAAIVIPFFTSRLHVRGPPTTS